MRKWRDQTAIRWANAHFPEINSKIAARVARCLIEELGVELERIAPHDRFHYEIELPGFQDVELAMKIEEEFGLNFSDNELSEIEDVAGLVWVVSQKIESRRDR